LTTPGRFLFAVLFFLGDERFFREEKKREREAPSKGAVESAMSYCYDAVLCADDSPSDYLNRLP